MNFLEFTKQSVFLLASRLLTLLNQISPKKVLYEVWLNMAMKFFRISRKCEQFAHRDAGR